MQNSPSKFLIHKDTRDNLNWANYTKENHLYYNGYVKPTELNKGAIKFLSTTKSLSSGTTPLLDLLKGKGKTEVISTSNWTWKMRGLNCRPAVVLRDEEPDNVTLGIQFTKFKIKLDTDFYVVGDIIYPSGPKKFQVRIQEEGVKDGDGMIYTVQLVTDDPSMYLPKKFVQPGTQWRKLFATYGEGRIGAGSTHNAETPEFEFYSWMSHIAKRYKVTGDAARTRLVIDPVYKGENGMYKSTDKRMWTYMQEAIFDNQWNNEIENLLMYSRSTQRIIDEQTGSVVRQGPGLQELMEEGNILYYNNFSVKLVENFIRDIHFNRVKPENRNIYMLTGQIGMEMWNNAIANIANGKFSDMSAFYIDEKGNKADRSQGGTLTFGNYWKGYNMQWGTLIPVWFPPYDDLEKHTEINPATGYPTESQRFTFLNLGLGEGLTNDNLVYMERERSASYGYVSGTFSPFGPANNELMAHAGDYYEVIRTKQCGIQLTDPKMTGELVFNMHY